MATRLAIDDSLTPAITKLAFSRRSSMNRTRSRRSIWTTGCLDKQDREMDWEGCGEEASGRRRLGIRADRTSYCIAQKSLNGYSEPGFVQAGRNECR